MSKSVYAKPTLCRLNQAYATAYATYAVCMEAYARGIQGFDKVMPKSLLSLSPLVNATSRSHA